MSNARVYRNAAIRIFNGKDDDLSCCAISQALPPDQRHSLLCFTPAIGAYGRIFSPSQSAISGYWLDCADWPCDDKKRERQMHEWRLTALCFARAMALAGDL